jgi:hypothetical protein
MLSLLTLALVPERDIAALDVPFDLTVPPLISTVPDVVLLIAVPLNDSTTPFVMVTMPEGVWIAVAFDLTEPPLTVIFVGPSMAVPLLAWVFSTTAVPLTVTAPLPEIVPPLFLALVTIASPLMFIAMFAFIAKLLLAFISPPLTVTLLAAVLPATT